MCNPSLYVIYGRELVDQYLLRMYTQSKEIRGAFCAKASEGKKEGLASRVCRAIKGIGLELACRIERAGAVVLLTVIVAPQLGLLPILFIAKISGHIKDNAVSRFVGVYFTLLGRELCVLGELLPAMFTPAFRPTFIPANAFVLVNLAAFEERAEIASSILWPSAGNSYKQARYLDAFRSAQTYEKLAENGNAKARYQLGMIDYCKEGKPTNSALAHFKIASDNGYGTATRSLAQESSNPVERKALFEKAAQQGDSYSQFILAKSAAQHDDADIAKKGIEQLEAMTMQGTRYAVKAAGELCRFYSGHNACKAIDLSDKSYETKAFDLAQRLFKAQLPITEKTKESFFDDSVSEGGGCLTIIYKKRLEKIKVEPEAYAKEWSQMVEDLQQAAKGNFESRLLLGHIYHDGLIVKRNDAMARKQLLKIDPRYCGYWRVQELLNEINHPRTSKIPLIGRLFT